MNNRATYEGLQGSPRAGHRQPAKVMALTGVQRLIAEFSIASISAAALTCGPDPE
jgi:hypothetical protein